jgi:hypothetical protein
MTATLAHKPPASAPEAACATDPTAPNPAVLDALKGAYAAAQSAPPEPLIGDLAAPMAYPVAALGPLTPVVRAVEGRALAPLPMIANSALATAALAVQGHGDVETLAGQAPASLYCLTLGVSGERKTSVDGHFTGPVRAHERKEAKAYRAALQEHAAKATLYEAQHADIRGRCKDKAKRAEAEADLRALREPTPPRRPERIVTEPTFEGLTRLYEEGQPALGIFSDEGGQFLGGYAMGREHKTKTMAALNALWGGADISRARKGDGTSTLYDRRLSLHLMVQPSVAHSFMADDTAGDIGFLPRFLICDPQSTIGTRLSSKMRPDSAGAIDAYAQRMGDILAAPLPIDPELGGVQARLLPLSEPARTLLVRFSDAVEAAQAPGGTLAPITGYASKAAEQAARIAGVLTLYAALDAPEVDGDTMANAIAIAQYHLTEAARLAQAARVSAESRQAEALRAWLSGFTHSEAETGEEDLIILGDILQCGPNALRERAKALRLMATLAEAGHVVPLPPDTIVRGSARRTAWRVVR